jgi:hypothetical protein
MLTMNQANQAKAGASGGGWIGGALGAASSIIGGIGQKKREERAINNQKKLMDYQTNNQWALNKQGAELQKKMWEETNYPAQVKMMKEAGLNPALAYGQGGGGGTTTGSQGGGSAASGNAPAPQPVLLGMITEMMKTLADVALNRKKTEGEELDNREKASDIEEKEAFKGGKTRAELQRDAEEAKQQATAMSYTKGDSELTEYQKGLIAEYETKSINSILQEAIKNGTVYENDVKEYKAELAKAKIDPDSNPLVREMMKAMAAEGIPLYKILQKVVRFFIN